MDTSKLRKFATFARSSLIEQVGTRLKTVLAEKSLTRRESPNAVKELESKIKILGEKRVVETVAYTWFNRFCALRYMDVNRYTRIGVLSPAEGQFQPEILAEAKMGHIDEELVPEATRKQVMRLLDGSDKSADPQGEAYRLLLVAICNYYHSLMPFMFEKIADYTELLLPDDLLSGTSIPAYTREALLPINCSPEYTKESVEVIGWLYQFYISEEKDLVMARKAVVPTDDIPAVTQLFTPHWIVRYLVENSLGRLWMLNHPDSKLREQMPYYIDGETESDFLRVSKPEDIRMLDPACGSGHMLTYAYDLLYAIYEEQGHSPTEIPGLILEHNLVGIEICDRAAPLASFALCMKARASDSRFFRRVVQPKVMALQNLQIEKDELEDYVESLGLADLFDSPLRQLLQRFEHAKNFGSLIRPCVDERTIANVRSALESKELGGQLFLRETHVKVLRALEQAEALTQRYNVVVANPPYLGGKSMNSELKTFIRDNFEAFKADLFSTFTFRCSSLAVTNGYLGFMTPNVWMSISTHEPLRNHMLDCQNLTTLVELPLTGFSGATVQICAFNFENRPSTGHRAGFIRLCDFKGVAAMEPKALEAVANPNCGWFFRASTKEFKSIPGSPIAYSVGSKIRRVFEEKNTLALLTDVRTGMQTGDNEKFLRYWYEVRKSDINPAASDYPVSPRRWFLYAKGGDFRKWYGNVEHVVDWANDGGAIRNCYVNGVLRSRVREIPNYFRNSASWSFISSAYFGCRYKEPGIFFDVAGSCALERDIPIGKILSFLCSSVAKTLLDTLNPTLNFQIQDIGNLPFIPTARTTSVGCEELLAISRRDWDNFETSWDFRDQPLLRPELKGATLDASWRNWEAQCIAAIGRTQELETENNRLFITAYGLVGELQPEVPEDQITLARADARKDMAAFLSYAVGCMMGRYSPEHPGVILANAGETLREFQTKVGKPLAELLFAPDHDGIVPVLDGEWFDDDIVARTRDFLRATFGESMLTENLRFIEDSLGKDLRKYFLNDFYKDHLQTYKKRPIYWLFSSPNGTFNALIYMHRYRPDTVGRVLQYLRDFRDKLAHHEEHLQITAGSASASKSEKTKAVKEVASIKRQLKELQEYEKTLFEVAARKIDIDLDKGVKHNYPLFDSVLRKIPGLNAKED